LIFGNPYVIGGAALIAFMSGWSVNGWRHDAQIKKAQKRVQVEEQIKLDDLRLSLDAANSERLSLAADLATEKSKLKIKYRTITQEVPIYAAQNTDICNYDLDPGLVRLLNAAATGSAVYPGTETEPAGQHSGLVSANASDLAGSPEGQSD
jgi:hypothetical protein